MNIPCVGHYAWYMTEVVFAKSKAGVSFGVNDDERWSCTSFGVNDDEPFSWSSDGVVLAKIVNNNDNTDQKPGGCVTLEWYDFTIASHLNGMSLRQPRKHKARNIPFQELVDARAFVQTNLDEDWSANFEDIFCKEAVFLINARHTRDFASEAAVLMNAFKNAIEMAKCHRDNFTPEFPFPLKLGQGFEEDDRLSAAAAAIYDIKNALDLRKKEDTIFPDWYAQLQQRIVDSAPTAMMPRSSPMALQYDQYLSDVRHRSRSRSCSGRKRSHDDDFRKSVDPYELWEYNLVLHNGRKAQILKIHLEYAVPMLPVSADIVYCDRDWRDTADKVPIQELEKCHGSQPRKRLKPGELQGEAILDDAIPSLATDFAKFDKQALNLLWSCLRAGEAQKSYNPNSTELAILFDYDRTLSAENASECHKLLGQVSNELPKDFQLQCEKLWQEFEVPSGDHHAFFNRYNDLLVEHNVTKEMVEAAVKNERIRRGTLLRPGTKDLFKCCADQGIKVVILSAGFEQIIEAAFHEEGIELPDSCTIVANTMVC